MNMQTKQNKKYKIGLVLSGGGVRGFAHIGALKALNEAGIYPDVISGVSSGAIAGAFYADGHKPEKIIQMFQETKFSKYLEMIFHKKGLLKMTGLTKIISQNLKARTFNELKIPLFVAATDLNNGKCIFFNKGELLTPLIASATVPVLFPPVKIDNKTFVDGGVLNNFPTEPLENKCKFLIGIHVNPFAYIENFGSMISIAERSFHLSIAAHFTKKIKKCSIFIEPPELKKYKLLEISKINDIYEFGYKETLKILAENKEKISELLNG
jgi:NTE family protein